MRAPDKAIADLSDILAGSEARLVQVPTCDLALVLNCARDLLGADSDPVHV